MKINDAKSLKGLSGKKLRNALTEHLVIHSKFEGKVKGRLVMFRMVKGEIKDQFVSNLLNVVPGEMYIPGEMYKNARESALNTLDDGSGFFFIIMAEAKSIKNKGGALSTK